MLLKKLLLTTFILVFHLPILAQSNLKTEKGVEAAVLQYIENFFENNFDEMNEVLHPKLAKRGLTPKGTLSEDYTPEVLKETLATKRPLPVSYQKNNVSSIEVFGNMASATLETGYPNIRWKENIHLLYMDNQWKIINVFWEYFPKPEKK